MSTENPIQRYGPVEKSECGRFWEDIDPIPEGDYVLFSDHQKAMAEVTAERDRLNTELAELRCRGAVVS